MSLAAFCLYWFWVYLSIIVYIFCKFAFVDRQNKSIKVPGWFILLMILVSFIPVLNWAIWFVVIALCIEDYYIRDGLKKWWNNLWIIKLLVKEY